jgi:selenocysteine lyase/cysteine desulfurase
LAFEQSQIIVKRPGKREQFPIYTRRDFVGIVSAAVASSVARPLFAQQEPSPGDPLGLRNDFPVTREFAYLNSPYITPSPQSVIDATKAFVQTKADDPVRLGPMLDETAAVREKFAKLVNADAGEVGLLSTTSEGENIVTAALDLQAGDNVVIDNLHYDTTFVLYDQLAKSRGIELRIIENINGSASPDAFAQRVDDRTRLISVSWISHQNGYRHDLQTLAELAHAHRAYLYVDAIQGVGALELDVRDTDVDFLAAGGYKWLLAGYGVAPFYVRSELLNEISVDRIGWRHVANSPAPHEYELYEDARKFGYATPAFVAIYQMSAALDYVMAVGVSAIEKHTVPLAIRANQALREQGFPVLTPARNESAIVAFEHGIEPSRAKQTLDDAGIQVSFREGDSQIRIGVALFNNDDDVDRLLAVTRDWA